MKVVDSNIPKLGQYIDKINESKPFKFHYVPVSMTWTPKLRCAINGVLIFI